MHPCSHRRHERISSMRPHSHRRHGRPNMGGNPTHVSGVIMYVSERQSFRLVPGVTEERLCRQTRSL